MRRVAARRSGSARVPLHCFYMRFHNKASVYPPPMEGTTPICAEPLDRHGVWGLGEGMRRILYAGGVFYTPDLIATALLDYAGALARGNTAATTNVPGITEDGQEADIEILIGPASQLISEPAPEGVADLPDHAATVERLQRLTLELSPPTPSFEPPFQEGDDWDGLDFSDQPR